MLFGSSVDAGESKLRQLFVSMLYSVEYVLLRCDALPGSDHVLY